MTLVTGTAEDIGLTPDNSLWIFSSPLRESSDGEGLITPKGARRYPVDGLVSVNLDPGPAVINYRGIEYQVEIPESGPVKIKDLIAAEIAFPTGTPPQLVGNAVDAYLDVHPIDWDDLDKPPVIAEGDTQEEARTAIDAVGGASVGAASDGQDTSISAGQLVPRNPLYIDPTQAPYNIKFDRYTYTTASMSSTTNATQLTVAGYTFTAADIGKKVKVAGAGAAGANLKTTISGVSSGKAVLVSPCLTTVSNVFCIFGTDNATGFAALFDDLSHKGRDRKLARVAVLPIGAAMYSGTLVFPAKGTVKGAAENWIDYDLQYGRFGGAENIGGTILYQMWDQNVDCARVRDVNTGQHDWNGVLEGFTIEQDLDNTAGVGLNFLAADNTSPIKIIDGGTISRVAVMGCANAGFNFQGGSITATLRDLYAYANGRDRKMFTANTTSGSPTLNSVSSFTGLAVGDIVCGAGVPVDSVIVSLNSGAGTMVISRPATATAAGASVQRAGSPGFRYKVADAESVHFDFISGDQNSGGLLRLVGPGSNALGAGISITNLKNEYGENTYVNGYNGPGTGLRPLDVPQGANAIVLDNLAASSVSIRGLVNWGDMTSGVEAYSPSNTFGRETGAAILSLNTAAPTVSWEGVTLHLPSSSTQTAYAFRDALTGQAIVADTGGRGSNKPMTLTDPRINKLFDAANGGAALDVGGVASPVNRLGVVNATAGNAPQIYAVGTDPNIPILAAPKGTSGFQVAAGQTGIAARISAVGPSADHALNLQSKGAAPVQANGVDVLTAVSKITSQLFTASGTFTAPATGVYRYTAWGGAGGGGGGGAAALTGGTATQVGGSGAGAGAFVESVVSLTQGDTVPVAIGAGGTGGTGGVASTDASGHAGSNGTSGGNTTVGGLTAPGGTFGVGGGANSTSTVSGGAYGGAPTGGSASASGMPGGGASASSSAGNIAGAPVAMSGRGGGGGSPANATNGGIAGTGAFITGKTGTANGGTGANAPANSGQGGDGGGGGAPGGAGGNGAAGGSGGAVIARVG